MQFWPSVTCIQVTCFPENKVYLDYVKSVCKHTQCEKPVTYLFGPEHHWHHALGLWACVLSSMRMERNCILARRGSPAPTHVQQITSAFWETKERTRCLQASVTGGLMDHSYKEKNAAFFIEHCVCVLIAGEKRTTQKHAPFPSPKKTA